MSARNLSRRISLAVALTLVCLGSFSSYSFVPATRPAVATAATTFTVIKTADSPDMYVRIPIGRYKIRDQQTWTRWGFTWDMVKIVSSQEMASIPRGPDITYVLRPFGDPTVYVVENGQMRAVTSEQAFLLAGYSWANLTNVEPGIINLLGRGANLVNPPVVRSPSDGAIYYLSGGKKYHIVSPIVYAAWGFTGYVDSPLVNQIPSGPDLTQMVRPFGDPTVWVIDHGTRRALPSPDALLLNNFSWADVSDADPDLIMSLPRGDIFWAPTTVKIPGSDTLYYAFNGVLHKVADTDTYNNWGFASQGTNVSPAAAAYPKGTPVTRLSMTEDGTVWRIVNGQRRVIPTAGIFTGYGFKWSDVTNMPLAALTNLLTDGGPLSYTTDTLEGKAIPATAGIAGLEQHLWTTAKESTEADHYALTGLAQTGDFLTCATGSQGCIRNGVAGTGAFGALDPKVEQWYITMRWGYCAWTETAGVDSSGRPGTICSTYYGDTVKAWYKYRKIIVSNPANGRKIVAAIGESGPAIWVTREQGVVSGLSPEGIDYLRAKHNTGGDSLQYGWAVDQSLPLGPLNY